MDHSSGGIFPPPYYCRSHLRSNTYNSLLHIFSHLHSYNLRAQPPPSQDHGNGGSTVEEQENQPKEPQFVASVDDRSGSTVVEQVNQLKEPQLIACVDNGGRTMVQQEKQQQEPQFVASAICKDLDLVKEATEEGTGDKGNTEVIIANNQNGLNVNASGSSTKEEQEKQPKEPLKNPNDLLQETTEEGTGDKGGAEYTGDNNYNVLNDIDVMMMETQEEVEGSSARHVEKLMDELDLVFKGTQQQEEDNVQVQGDQHNQLVAQTLRLPPSSTANVSESAMKGHDTSQQKETELAESVCIASQERKFEKETQCGQKVAADLDINIFEDDDGVPHSGTLEDKHEMQNSVSCFDIPFEEGEMKDGEICGDFMMDSNLFNMSSVDPVILQLDDIDEELNCKIGGNGEKEQGFESNSFIVNTPKHGSSEVVVSKDHANSFAIKQKYDENNKNKSGPGNKKEVFKPKTVVENITFPCNLGNGEKEQGFESNSCIVKPLQHGRHNSEVNKAGDLPANFAPNQVYYGDLWEVDASKDMSKGDVSRKRKRGPGNNDHKKAKKKQKQRKKRAEINKLHDVKRLKLSPPLVQKPKPPADCRHYRHGRCYEGDKCKFSHDIVPLTKSTPCRHFAHHSCLKGDGCPFDHQLSKYPCTNFVSQGSCGKGDACLFSHQMPTEQGIPTVSNFSRPELKKSPAPSGNTNSSMHVNNHGCNPVQQNHVSNSVATHSPINAEHKVTSSVQKNPTAPPKGISFLNVAKPSTLSTSTPKQCMVTANKTSADQSAFGTNKTSVGIPKNSPAVTPKGINFLSFGKGSVCSFKSSSRSLLNRESSKLQQASSSLYKVAYSEVYSHGDHSHSKSQGGEKVFDNSLTSTMTSSSMLLVSPSFSNQPLASSSGQRAMISTLGFAAEHESDIKMKSLGG